MTIYSGQGVDISLGIFEELLLYTSSEMAPGTGAPGPGLDMVVHMGLGTERDLTLGISVDIFPGMDPGFQGDMVPGLELDIFLGMVVDMALELELDTSPEFFEDKEEEGMAVYTAAH